MLMCHFLKIAQRFTQHHMLNSLLKRRATSKMKYPIASIQQSKSIQPTAYSRSHYTLTTKILSNGWLCNGFAEALVDTARE